MIDASYHIRKIDRNEFPRNDLLYAARYLWQDKAACQTFLEQFLKHPIADVSAEPSTDGSGVQMRFRFHEQDKQFYILEVHIFLLDDMLAYKVKMRMEGRNSNEQNIRRTNRTGSMRPAYAAGM